MRSDVLTGYWGLAHTTTSSWWPSSRHADSAADTMMIVSDQSTLATSVCIFTDASFVFSTPVYTCAYVHGAAPNKVIPLGKESNTDRTGSLFAMSVKQQQCTDWVIVHRAVLSD